MLNMINLPTVRQSLTVLKVLKFRIPKCLNLMNLPNVSQTLMVLDSLLFFVMLF